MKHFWIISAALMLSACVTTNAPEAYLQRKGVQITSQTQFDHCSEYGCKTVQSVGLDDDEWAQISAIFTPASVHARGEREQIAQAIAVFEDKIGQQTGTHHDKSGTFENMTAAGQLDCVDESTNTTTYLSLLEGKNLLRHHTVRAPTVRLPLINSNVGWPHQSAMILEKQSGAYFVVDSWFHDNGAPAEIVPLESWKQGWSPKWDRIAMRD